MTPSELKEVYVRAAARSRCAPNKSEESEWKRAFEYADKTELGSAIEKFFEASSHSPKGVWMPKVDELRPLVEQEQRRRISRSTDLPMLVRWECPNCTLTCCGLTAENDLAGRKCQRCGSYVNEIARVRASEAIA
jgi:hypothetical protein